MFKDFAWYTFFITTAEVTVAFWWVIFRIYIITVNNIDIVGGERHIFWPCVP